MAIGVAESMKKDFGDAINLHIYTNDALEAKNFDIKSSTTVFVNGELVPLNVALANETMNAYLKERL